MGARVNFASEFTTLAGSVFINYLLQKHALLQWHL